MEASCHFLVSALGAQLELSIRARLPFRLKGDGGSKSSRCCFRGQVSMCGHPGFFRWKALKQEGWGKKGFGWGMQNEDN